MKIKRLTKAEKMRDAAMATAPKELSIRDASNCTGILVIPWYCAFAKKENTRVVSIESWFNDGENDETVGVEMNDPAKIRELAAGLIAAAEWLEETV